VGITLYDELAYRCASIEWSAPERLAAASALHGGPRSLRRRYRVLELGCGNGANLIPLAYFRPHAQFVGVDGAGTQIEAAQSRASQARLTNVAFAHADFREADAYLQGSFDYIIAHGVFSWIDDDTRHALLSMCAKRLSDDGLLYMNYNCKPGWNLRGMIRDFLLAQTARGGGLAERAQVAQEVAARLVQSFMHADQPYSAQLVDEFSFVRDSDASYVAHEYLAPQNRSFWRSEFEEMTNAYGLRHIADADFSYDSGRTSAELPGRLREAGIVGRSLEDTADFLCNRQLHSPILARHTSEQRPLDVLAFFEMQLASCLAFQRNEGGVAWFAHPCGVQVEVKTTSLCDALRKLQSLWPHGVPMKQLFTVSESVMEDLMLLHRNGLVDIRYMAPDDGDPHDNGDEPVLVFNGHVTNRYHCRERLRLVRQRVEA
jgi:SAM-dependent methyltransferase